jgi:hypothetical protein
MWLFFDLAIEISYYFFYLITVMTVPLFFKTSSFQPIEPMFNVSKTVSCRRKIHCFFYCNKKN